MLLKSILSPSSVNLWNPLFNLNYLNIFIVSFATHWLKVGARVLWMSLHNNVLFIICLVIRKSIWMWLDDYDVTQLKELWLQCAGTPCITIFSFMHHLTLWYFMCRLKLLWLILEQPHEETCPPHLTHPVCLSAAGSHSAEPRDRLKFWGQRFGQGQKKKDVVNPAFLWLLRKTRVNTRRTCRVSWCGSNRVVQMLVVKL